MAEGFFFHVGHAVAHPFVEAGRSVRRTSGDILEGGRLRRERESYGFPVKDSRVQDLLQAVVPTVLLSGAVGFSIPLLFEAGREIASDIQLIGIYTGDVNWWVALGGALGGSFLGAVGSIEYSRRIGRDSREYREELEQRLRTPKALDIHIPPDYSI